MPALASNCTRLILPLAPQNDLHTAGHVACPACERVRRAMIEPGALAALTFFDAAHIWLASHSRRISSRSKRDYENCIKQLKYFFSALRLSDIHIGHFEQYQAMRAEGSGSFARVNPENNVLEEHPAGPSRINHELNTLSQVLARANLWAPILPYYQPLKLPRPRVGCAMTEEEEKTLFAVASSKPRWKVAYLCSLVTANTTAGPGEIRMLRLMDVDLSLQPPHAPFGVLKIDLGAKNEYRIRPIPLNRTAHFALRELIARARDLGAVRPDHYLLPHRADHGNGKRRGDFDPTRPQSSWRKAWEKVRTSAGLPHLRQYDLRHHVITRLLENENVSERTVIELAGHVSKKMLERYSHIRMRTKLEGVLALERSEDHLLPEKKPPLPAVPPTPDEKCS